MLFPTFPEQRSSETPHKERFLPPHYFEKMGELLSYLPPPGLYRTEMIKKEGEGDDENHSQVFFCLFVLASFG